ncbi:unnamed protein product, partial [Strongylus vulgaris]
MFQNCEYPVYGNFQIAYYFRGYPMPGNATVQIIPLPTLLTAMAFSAVGIVGNGLIIVATVTSSKLRSRCGILICLLAIADFVVAAYLAHLATRIRCFKIHLRILLLNGSYIHSNVECYLQSIYGLFALHVQAGMGLSIGIDRLLAVASPI